ncbi:MAG: hypothetical protein VW667_03955 [Candidatus Neomarinimicrobiota bacterium]
MQKNNHELLERVRNYVRTTRSGRRVDWDEPSERDDNPDVIRHNAAVANYLKKRKQKNQSRDKLKSQNKVPSKDGKPMWEQMQEDVELNESVNRFIMKFRGLYYSGKTMRFRDWLRVIEDLVDELD